MVIDLAGSVRRLGVLARERVLTAARGDTVRARRCGERARAAGRASMDGCCVGLESSVRHRAGS